MEPETEIDVRREVSRLRHEEVRRHQLHRRRFFFGLLAAGGVGLCGYVITQPDPYLEWWWEVVGLALIVPFLASFDWTL